MILIPTKNLILQPKQRLKENPQQVPLPNLKFAVINNHFIDDPILPAHVHGRAGFAGAMIRFVMKFNRMVQGAVRVLMDEGDASAVKNIAVKAGYESV